MSATPISPSDRAWLRLDDPRSPMIITCLVVFSQSLELERLKGLLARSLLRFPRFRQRLSASARASGWPRWVEEPHIDLDRHVAVYQLPDGFGQPELEQLVGVTMAQPLDPDQPLWKFHLFNNYCGGSALVVRLHHSLSDGIGLMQLLLSLSETPLDEAQMPPGLSAGTKLAGALDDDLLTPDSLGEELQRLLGERGYVRKRLGQARDLVKAGAKLALRRRDPANPLIGKPAGVKRCVWSSPLPLPQVKAIGKKCSATVNDVLVSTLAGALGRYLAERGAKPDGNLRAAIPVSLRPLELERELGNQLGTVFLELPVGVDDPIRRLEQVHGSMQRLKSSAEPLAVYYALNVLGVFPNFVERMALDFFDSQASLVFTNLPGPRIALQLAGAPVELLMAWPPQLGQIGLGVSIISYNGQVRFGAAGDTGLVPDPERLSQLFLDEFARLQKAARKIRPSGLSTAVAKLGIQIDGL